MADPTYSSQPGESDVPNTANVADLTSQESTSVGDAIAQSPSVEAPTPVSEAALPPSVDQTPGRFRKAAAVATFTVAGAAAAAGALLGGGSTGGESVTTTPPTTTVLESNVPVDIGNAVIQEPGAPEKVRSPETTAPVSPVEVGEAVTQERDSVQEPTTTTLPELQTETPYPEGAIALMPDGSHIPIAPNGTAPEGSLGEIDVKDESAVSVNPNAPQG